MCASPSLSLSEVLTAVWFLFGPAAVSRTRDGASSVDVRGAWPVCVVLCFLLLCYLACDCQDFHTADHSVSDPSRFSVSHNVCIFRSLHAKHCQTAKF